MEELITLNQLKEYDEEKTNKIDARFNNAYNYIDNGLNELNGYVNDGFNAINLNIANLASNVANGFNAVNNQFNDAYNYVNNGFNTVNNQFNAVNLNVANLASNVNNGFNNVNNQFNAVNLNVANLASNVANGFNNVNNSFNAVNLNVANLASSVNNSFNAVNNQVNSINLNVANLASSVNNGFNNVNNSFNAVNLNVANLANTVSNGFNGANNRINAVNLNVANLASSVNNSFNTVNANVLNLSNYVANIHAELNEAYNNFTTNNLTANRISSPYAEISTISPTGIEVNNTLGHAGQFIGLNANSGLDWISFNYDSTPTTGSTNAVTSSGIKNYVDTELNKKLDKTEKGSPNGVATLDAAGRVPYSQLPESAMEYKGAWDASKNTPTLKDGAGDNGDFYIVSTAGTVNFGTAASPRNVTFYVNDRVIYDGGTSKWERLPASDVRTVNGLTGDVTLTASNVNYDATTTIKAAIDNKVNKVAGKGLSTNDFTTAYKNKLDGIESGAEANVQPDWTQTDTSAEDYIKNKPKVDTVMSGTSTNAVQNKVIKSYVDTQVTAAITQVLNTGF